MKFHIREATPNDTDSILPLFPRLANFTLPPRRNPKDLWEGDADLLRQWSQGEAPHCLVYVATEAEDGGPVVGAAMVSLREELLSHEPSAHLEVVVIAEQADGHGLGKALIAAAEVGARERGARSITLHVFANNHRARHVYEQLGYDGELLRYIKHFT